MGYLKQTPNWKESEQEFIKSNSSRLARSRVCKMHRQLNTGVKCNETWK